VEFSLSGKGQLSGTLPGGQSIAPVVASVGTGGVGVTGANVVDCPDSLHPALYG